MSARVLHLHLADRVELLEQRVAHMEQHLDKITQILQVMATAQVGAFTITKRLRELVEGP